MILDSSRRMNSFRKWTLAAAEVVDAWRVVPRFVLVGYGYLVYYLTIWFLTIEQEHKTECNESLITTLLDKGIDINQAQAIACTVVDVVGGPSTAHTAFITTICGLATGIFGLYVGTGRKWDQNPFKYWGRRESDRKSDGATKREPKPKPEILEE